MKHEVKVGDRFRLGAWEWEVVGVDGCFFSAERKNERKALSTVFHYTEASSLDWVKPEVMFTRAEAEKVMQLAEEYAALPLEIGKLHPSFKDFLDAHTEKE